MDLQTGAEVSTSGLYTFIFGLPSLGASLKEWGNSPSADGNLFGTKKYTCLTLLTNLLRVNSFESLGDVDATTLELVSGIHEGSAHGAYLPLLIVVLT